MCGCSVTRTKNAKGAMTRESIQADASNLLRDFSFQANGQTRQQQLYAALKQRILSARIAANMRLPASRLLATELGVSRNTVSNAYEQLKAEGYIRSKQGAGHYVASDLPEGFFRASQPELQTVQADDMAVKAPAMPLSELSLALEDELETRRFHSASFSVGVPDLKAFPLAKWRAIYQRHIQRINLLGYDSSQGLGYLREVLSEYLRSSRGLVCEPEQIVITAGAQQAASIAIQVTLNEGDQVYMEDPGYIGMREAFRARHCQIQGLKVDEQGLRLDQLPAVPQGKALYLTPTHQYPMGGIMPLAHRLEVLAWARRHGIWLFEDDYDSEYHYDHRPIAALQGLGLSEQVIYIGSFSKVLFPSLRLGYLVVPKRLVKACCKVKYMQAGQSPAIDQAVVADFIAEGHFARHLRQMRVRYQGKFEAMIAACQQHLSDYAVARYTGAGMHVVLILKDGLGLPADFDKSLVASMVEQGLYASPLSAYYLQPAQAYAQQGLVLGFANTAVAQIAPKVLMIRQILLRLLAQLN